MHGRTFMAKVEIKRRKQVMTETEGLVAARPRVNIKKNKIGNIRCCVCVFSFLKYDRVNSLDPENVFRTNGHINPVQLQNCCHIAL